MVFFSPATGILLWPESKTLTGFQVDECLLEGVPATIDDPPRNYGLFDGNHRSYPNEEVDILILAVIAAFRRASLRNVPRELSIQRASVLAVFKKHEHRNCM